MTTRSQDVRPTRFRGALALAVLLATVAAPAGEPARAQAIETLEAREYRACMSLINVDPDEAFERALSLQDAGGGAPAKHCAAAALAAGGHHAEAARRFEALATEMPEDAPATIVADILGQAGIAWVTAGEPGKAYPLQTAALDLAPRSVDLRVDRAVALAALNRLWEAVDDLDAALALDPGRVEAHALRASAYRQLDVLDLALESADRALELDPDHPEALLERGAIHRLRGAFDRARKDWITLIERHEGRPAADLARRNLDRLDFGPPDVEAEAGSPEDADGSLETGAPPQQ